MIMSAVERLQNHWGLTRSPFAASIPTASLVTTRGHSEAVARIRWAISQPGIAVVAGEVGAGKTVAARAALAGIEPARHISVYVPDPTIGLKGIHAHIVTTLGGQPRYGVAALAVQAQSLLAGERDERGRTPVVIVDEAHLLSVEDLEGLRMLTNTAMDTGADFALILLGQPTLRRRLKLGVLSALDQRIATRYTIDPMTPEETTTYIHAHLAWAGRTDTLFSDDAIADIHQASRGYPRGVNTLALAAMLAAYADQKAIIDRSSAQKAIADNTE